MTKREKAELVCRSKNCYVMFEVMYGTVCKIFNDGHGALGLYKFGDTNKVAVNTLLEKKSDRTNLLKLFPDAMCIAAPLGYPDWYNRSLPNPDNLELTEETKC